MTQLWVWIIGIVMSIVLGIVAARVRDDNRANGLLAGLVSLVLTGMTSLVVEGIAEQRSTAAFMERVVPTLRHPVWRGVVKDIAEYDSRPQAQDGSSRFEEVLLERVRLPISRAVQQARNGAFAVDSVAEAVLVSVALIEKATQSIRATSYITPDGWWTTEAGRRYDASIRQAVSRGVKCERVYIVEDEGELTRLAEIVKSQREYGVEIKYVLLKALRPDQPGDFIVIDGLSAGELVLDAKRAFQSAKFHVTGTMAGDFESRFKTLWVQSAAVTK